MRRNCSAGVAAILTGAALLLGACTSSGGSAAPSSPALSSSSSALSTSAAPSTSASSSTPTPTPTPTATRRPPPLSHFESDPAVKAWRVWATEAAKTVNTGHQTSPALRRLMTANFARTMGNILGPDVGLYYPGPVPFQPVAVSVSNANARVVRGCLFQHGFTWKSASAKKPAQKRLIGPALVYAVRQNGRWIVDNLTSTNAVNCRHVEVKTQRWDASSG